MEGSEAIGLSLIAIAFLIILVAIVVFGVTGVFFLLKGRRFGWIGIALGLLLSLLPLSWIGGTILEVLTAREYWGPEPSRTIEPLDEDGDDLRTLARVGDLDLDGADDLACVSTLSDEGQRAHRLIVFSARSGERIFQGEFETGSPSEYMTLASAGDADGDGSPDIVIASNGEPMGSNSASVEVHVRSGKDGASIRKWTTPRASLGFFISVAGAGDVDGDDFGEILIGSTIYPASGVVRLFSGRDGALLGTVDNDPMHGGFGTALCGLGDVDGDGRADFAVSSSEYDRPGCVQAFSGADRRELWRVVGPTANASIGDSLVHVDDRGGDGHRDLLIGGSNASLIVSTRTGRALETLQDSNVIALLADWDGDGRSETLRHGWGAGTMFYDHPIYSRLEVVGSKADAILGEIKFPGPPVVGRYVAAFGQGSDSFAVQRGDRIFQFSKACFPAQ